MNAICLHCYVTGRVQGVFFRRETVIQAKALGIKGFVKNLDDGRVEVLICGEQAKLKEMVDWLWVGPPRAEVSHVETKAVSNSKFSFKDFELRS